MGNIIGSIQGLKGATDDTVYDMFFTETRIIAAIVIHFTDFASTRNRSILLDFFFGNLSEHRRIKLLSERLTNERRLAFKSKTVDEILAMHKANIEIDCKDIVSINVRKTLLAAFLELAVRRDGAKKIVFRFEKNRATEIEELVQGLCRTI